MPYKALLEDFKRKRGSLAFKCIEDSAKARKEFAEALEARAKAPWKINQGGAPLCGPAAFMYCIAKDRPTE